MNHKEIELLNKNLLQPVMKAIGSIYFGDIGGATAGGITGLISSKVQDFYERKEIGRKLEALAEKVLESLTPIFEEQEAAVMAIEPVSQLLMPIALHIADSEYLVGKNLDPQAILRDVEERFSRPHAQYSELEIELFKRARERLIRCLVEIAPSLPKFASASVGRSLQQFANFVESFDKVVQRIERIEDVSQFFGRFSKNEAEEYRKFEIDYRLAVARQVDYLELFGADISPESRRHELSVAYVTLSLDSTPSASHSEFSSFDLVLGKLASQKRQFLLIRGEAGSGKSTLFRWAALAGANTNDSERRKTSEVENSLDRGASMPGGLTPLPWQVHVPFLIRLRDCQHSLPAAHELAAHCVKTIGLEPSDWTLNVLRAGRGLILLDGVDEVPNFQRLTMAKQIENLVKQYPQNIFLVSTRPSAVPQGWLASVGFTEARVNPLGEQDKIELIDNWHRAVAKELSAATGREVDLSEKALALHKLIRDNLAISRLATSPLLCAMICALHHGRNGDVPESPPLLCEALCQMLLHRRESEAGIDMSKFPQEYRNLNYAQKRMLVKRLAHYMVKNHASVIEVKTADQLIARTLERFPSHVVPVDGRPVRGPGRGKATRTALLRQRRRA